MTPLFPADVAIVGSEKYVHRLEQKQASLMEAREDTGALVSMIDGIIVMKMQKHANVPSEAVKQAPLIPQSARMALDTIPLHGPLAPSTSLGTVKEKLEEARDAH
ncbi:MAG: hypothetical protein PHS37_00285 [Candidatus Omnitrophica bacterium]|nr:hypothetical protein [Candidatus Omnitrophota bacterium]